MGSGDGGGVPTILHGVVYRTFLDEIAEVCASVMKDMKESTNYCCTVRVHWARALCTCTVYMRYVRALCAVTVCGTVWWVRLLLDPYRDGADPLLGPPRP